MGQHVHTLKTPKLNIVKLCVFELVFKLLCGLSFGPLFRGSLHLLMAATHFNYITWENLGSFCSEPLVVVAIIVMLIVLAVLSLFEVASIIHILSPAQKIDDALMLPYFLGGTSSLKQAMYAGARAARDVMRPKNIGFLIFSMLILPLSNVGVASRVVERFTIPEFVMTAIYDDFELTLVYLAIILLINTLVIKLIYVLPLMSAGYDFQESVRLSLKLSRKHFFADVFMIEGIQLIFFTAFVATVFGLQVLAGYAQDISITHFFVKQALLALPLSAIVFITIVYTLMTPALVWITVLWQLNKHVLDLGVMKPKVPEHPRVIEARQKLRHKNPLLPTEPISTTHRGIRPAILGAYLLFWLISTGILALMQTGLWRATKWMSPSTVQISAHRGDVSSAPENTMAAFRAAKEAGADWVELDVQESKDGQIYISHDSSFRRIAAVNKYAWELNYSEIAKLSAGAYFGDEFADERFPLLQDVLIWAKQNNMRLNIELKPTGHEKDFQEAVAALIESANMSDKVIVTSMNYATLEKMKQVAPRLKTAYVMTLAFGDLDKLSAADIYSVEQTSCTKSFVRYAHKHGKEVLAWTVSDPEHIAKCIVNGADNIITDDVEVARAVRESPAAVIAAESMVYQFLGINFVLY